MHVHRVARNIETEFVRLAKREPDFDPATGEDHGVAVRIMVAPEDFTRLLAPFAEQRALLDPQMLRAAVIEDLRGHRQALLTTAAQTELAAVIAALAERRLALEHQLAAWLEAAPED